MGRAAVGPAAGSGSQPPSCRRLPSPTGFQPLGRVGTWRLRLDGRAVLRM